VEPLVLPDAFFTSNSFSAGRWEQGWPDRPSKRLHLRNRGHLDVYTLSALATAPSVYLPNWPDGLAIHVEYNAAISSVTGSRANVYLVPLYENFLGHGAHCRQFWRSTYRNNDPHYWFFDNVKDPNDRGYDAIRRIYLNAIITNMSLRIVGERK